MNTPFPQIPVFDLYGEADGLPDLLHVEDIRDRAGPLNWTIRVHRHPALVQVLWIGAGGGTAHIDGTPHRLGAGTCVYIPRLCPHGFQFDEGCEGLVLTLPMATVTRALRAASPPELGVPRILPSGPGLRDLLHLLVREHRRSDPYRSDFLTGLVGLILLWVARRAGGQTDAPPRGPYDALVGRFLDLLEDRFRTDHEVAAYAARLFKTPSHLNRACNQVLGKSASALIRERLMLEARRELAYSARPVADIAYSLGYADPAYFTRVFRKDLGQTPRAFRLRVNG